MLLYRLKSNYLTLILGCCVCSCIFLVFARFFASSDVTAISDGGHYTNEDNKSLGIFVYEEHLRDTFKKQGTNPKLTEEQLDLTFLGLHGGSNAGIYQNGPPPFVPAKIPLIWIGSMPRSGTTLMRALLDAHPLVRCGEETRVIPRILEKLHKWTYNSMDSKRLQEAGVFGDVLDAAMSSFILNIILRHGDAASRYCNKDPFALIYMDYLLELFPNSKFLLMIRYAQCERAGPERCMPVYYEQLVLQPKRWLQEILLFLQLPWDDAVLHHEDKIGSEISLSLVEYSTDQIERPVNTDALSKWVGFYSKELLAEMGQVAPMLQQLGYDPAANPPKYGSADESVRRNTNLLHKDNDTLVGD